MVEVVELFEGEQLTTRIWVTQGVVDEFDRYQRKQERDRGSFLKKLRYWAQAGFRLHEGEGRPIRHEGNGVYRIAHGDLFRLIGFYETDAKADFIVVEALLKRGQKLSSSDRQRIAVVAQIREQGLWTRRQSHGDDEGPAEVAG